MTTRKELEELIIRVDERTKVIPDINEHLRTLNGSVADVTRTASVNRAIADSAKDEAAAAQKSADNIGKNFTRFLITFAICLLGIVFGIGVPMWISS